MDGSPQTQDRQRPMVSGNGSSRQVVQSLREMEANHRSYGLRLTAVPPFDRLIEDIQFLCENTACQPMQAEAAYNTRRSEEGQPEFEEGLKFLQVFFAAQRLAEQSGRMLRCSGSDVGKITSVPCGSPFNTLVVTPQNNLVACFEVVNDSHPLAGLATIGRIIPQGVEIEEARARLRQKIDERRASCRDCFCYWPCAGGCMIRSFPSGSDDHLKHGVYCELTRTLQREMLLKHIAAGDGLWRRKPPA
jgi:radical SAM protein with 4Fe4S-binding SPASM domain